MTHDEIIAEARKIIGKSVNQYSIRNGLPYYSVRRVVNGENVSLTTFTRIIEALGMPIDIEESRKKMLKQKEEREIPYEEIALNAGCDHKSARKALKEGHVMLYTFIDLLDSFEMEFESQKKETEL